MERREGPIPVNCEYFAFDVFCVIVRDWPDLQREPCCGARFWAWTPVVSFGPSKPQTPLIDSTEPRVLGMFWMYIRRKFQNHKFFRVIGRKIVSFFVSTPIKDAAPFLFVPSFLLRVAAQSEMRCIFRRHRRVCGFAAPFTSQIARNSQTGSTCSISTSRDRCSVSNDAGFSRRCV